MTVDCIPLSYMWLLYEGIAFWAVWTGGMNTVTINSVNLPMVMKILF